MPVKRRTQSGTGRSARTSDAKRSTTCPRRTTTTPISITWSTPSTLPVVSRSTTTKVASVRGSAR